MPDNKVTILVGVVGTAAVSAAFSKLGGGIQALQRFALPLTGIITAALSGRAITSGITNVTRLASNLDDLQRRTGGTAARLLVLRQVLTDTGAGAETLGQKMNLMQREISDAATKGGSAATALTRIGLSARELSTLAPEEQFRILSERIGGIENPAQRAAIAMDIFGRSGGELLPLFSDTGAIATASRALGKMPELLQRNLPVLDSISDSLGRLGIKKQQFFAGLLDQVGGGIKRMLDALEGIDLTGLGQRVGAFVNVAIDAWNEGKFSEFIGLTIRAGFEIGKNAAKKAWHFLVTEVGMSDSFKFVSVQIANEITKGFASGLLAVARLILTMEIYVMSLIKTVLSAEFNLLKALINNLLDFFANNLENNVNAAIALLNKIPGFNIALLSLPRSNLKVNDVAPALTIGESFNLAGVAVDSLNQKFKSFVDASTRDTAAFLGVNKLLTGEFSAQNEEADRMRKKLQNRAWAAAENPFATMGGSKPREPLGPNPNSLIDQMQLAIEALQKQLGTVAQNIARTFTETIGNAIDAISNGITKLILGTVTWGQALREIGTSILTQVINSIVRMFLTWIVQTLVLAALQKVVGRSANVEAATSAAAWGPAAVAASIASYGAAAGVGTASAIAGMAAGAVAGAALSGAAGAFAEGGFTGAGSKFEPAGIVHRGEFVIPADMTSRIGVPALDSWLANNGTGAPGGSPTINNDNRTKVAIFDDRAAMRDWLRSTEGREMVLDIVGKEGHRVMRT